MIRSFAAHAGLIRDVQISFDDRLLYSAGDDRTVKIWSSDCGALLRSLTHGSNIFCVNPSNDGKMFIIGSKDGILTTFDTENGDRLQNLYGHKDSILSVALTSNGRFIISGSAGYEDKIKIWDVVTGDCIKTFGSNFYSNSITSINVLRNNRYFITTSANRAIRVWKITK